MERSELIAWIRGEIVGPSRPLRDATIVNFVNDIFEDPVPRRRGALCWSPEAGATPEEVLFYDGETPHRKYGAGLLHPPQAQISESAADKTAAQAADHLGVDPTDDELDDENGKGKENGTEGAEPEMLAGSDEFEVMGADVRHPPTIGISFCARLEGDDALVILLPQARQFRWQSEASSAFPVNGRYESCTRIWMDDEGVEKENTMWRRHRAVLPNTAVAFLSKDFQDRKKLQQNVEMPKGSPIKLRVEVFPRSIPDQPGIWLLTVVLRNVSEGDHPGQEAPRKAVLYQTYFEAVFRGGHLEKYPESQRPFGQLDSEEQSLTLLYRESATWGIGHGCAAGWDAEPGQSPEKLYAEVLPAVETPSMTPDIKDDQGNQIRLSMRDLSGLPDAGDGLAWQSLCDLAEEYAKWINQRREAAQSLGEDLRAVALRHMDACDACLVRIREGIELLRTDPLVRRAFRLANLSMLLQQIATKQLPKRRLEWNVAQQRVAPEGQHQSPWQIFEAGGEQPQIGNWRAFQIAFFLMSLRGMRDGASCDREIVDLIWFPTGGGKTEAYLGVMAFYLFHQRLLIAGDATGALHRDGTNVLMRYTLRMLTTQQFQRAASLICAMEFLRRNPSLHTMGSLGGARFSLGLWIGSDATPNTLDSAEPEIRRFRKGDIEGNPLVLTECPWCRAEIGRYNGPRPNLKEFKKDGQWNIARTQGIGAQPNEGPLLLCPDGGCSFGAEDWREWLPVEVIDERIYKTCPSLVIATADKFAIIAYRPAAAALFGRDVNGKQLAQRRVPPGLIIQDELHLISGPLGTMYGFYEAVIERLCSLETGDGHWIKPKLISSTATIRGAADQAKSLYARTDTRLFPCPGLDMGDSFFGKYAREENGRLSPGRLYLGLHASGYGSVLTTQVRAFSSALCRPFCFAPDRRDPWWTLLVFYNSLRELGGAKTLFDSDIRSRLKFLFNREDFAPTDRRNLRIVEELTSRLSQAEIVGMMDKLGTPYVNNPQANIIDACLASNIIEVGVDIDRLSLMGVVGQPKTTAQYIQVTGRVGRKWWERAGLILMIYNPSKSRDRSHYEQFHSYHRRLYERVEPTSVTPFAISAIQRALAGALITWARTRVRADVNDYASHEDALVEGYEMLRERCMQVQVVEDRARSLEELERQWEKLSAKWQGNPQEWEHFPPDTAAHYLMRWPGQYATLVQKQRGVAVASSMRQVDRNAELTITQGYVVQNAPAEPVKGPQQ